MERLLQPGGLCLNHGITRAGEGWPDTPETRFINRTVLPGGELDSLGNVVRAMERAGLEILDVEALRPHYALTLRHWVERLERRREEARAHVPEATLRLWRLYMLACAREFEAGSIGGVPDSCGETRNPVRQSGVHARAFVRSACRRWRERDLGDRCTRAWLCAEPRNRRRGEVTPWNGCDNRRLARAAKLAGAPRAPGAGLCLHRRLGNRAEAGEPLFTLYAEAPGELAYALEYVGRQNDIVRVR